MMQPEQVKCMAQAIFPQVQQFRRHLHQFPELSYQEHQTAAFVCQALDQMGIRYQSGIAQTGVVAIIEGRNPNGRTLALRADMDALPIQEENDVPYKSKHEGVMHACGHDVHTACLLGAASILQETRQEWEGSIKLLFQPSEEKLPGGAKAMMEEGVLEQPSVDAIFGQHVFTPYKAGTVAFCPGKMMASTDELYFYVYGKGGHAAYPHLLKDPVPVAAQIITAVQQLVSRMVTPMEPVVLSIGKIVAEGATNVIPNEVYMEGTLRAMNEQVRQQVLQQLQPLVSGICRAFGLEGKVDIREGYPSLYNNEALTERAIHRAQMYLGKENVFMAEPRMGAEDFAFYSQQIPACFYRLGTGNPEKGIQSFIHTPTFDIDEDALPVGTGLMVWNAIEELRSTL